MAMEPNAWLPQLDEQGSGDPVFRRAEIRREPRDHRAGRAAVAAGRRHPSRSGEVGNICFTVVAFHPESDELARHEVERDRAVPGLVGVAGICGEVGRPGGGGRAVDRRQQHQVAAGIRDRASAQRQRERVLVEPEPVVRHEPEEVLRGAARGAADAAHAAAVLASSVDGERERRLAQERIRVVEVLDLDAVVGVEALAIGVPQGVRAPVLISQKGDRARRPPQDLQAEAGSRVDAP